MAQPTENRADWQKEQQLTIALLLTAAMAWWAWQVTMPADCVLSSVFADAKEIADGPLQLQVAFTIAGALAGLAVSYKLSRKAAMIAATQCCIALLILQAVLWSTLTWSMHPLGQIASFLIGAAAGIALRTINQARARHESRYFQLQVREGELQQARLQMVKQDEFERRMLAGDLHDQVLNDLKLLRHLLAELASGKSGQIERMDSLIVQTLGATRQVMDSLSPMAIEHLGLPAAVEDCLRQCAQAGNFKPCFRSAVQPSQLSNLSSVEQSLLYRLIQEALTNARKHAHAQSVSISLEHVGSELVVRITDDGSGLPFDWLGNNTHKRHTALRQSRGMVYMKQRASLIGATVSWQQAAPRGGTTVEIRLNLSRREGQ